MIHPKEAFKLGFCLKLAEQGLTLSRVQLQLTELVEKQGMAAPAVGTLGALGGAAATTAIGALMLPSRVGELVGSQVTQLADDEEPSLDEARKKYMIKRYRDLIKQRRAELENRLLSQAMREVRR